MKKIFFQDKGNGESILLIHGFPMSSEIWEPVSNKLSERFRVITVDLPGFGKSPLPDVSFSLDDIACELLDFLKQQNIHKVLPIGHSLGGYVALAMVEQDFRRFVGLGLLHSTAYADTPEKKESRTKVVDFINKNGVEAFTSNFIDPLFADRSHPGISGIRNMNLKATKEAVVGYTEAMRDRPDRRHVLQKFSQPILFITGDIDPGISPSSVVEQSTAVADSEVRILANQAHMSLIEDISVITQIIVTFADRCYSRVTT